MSRDTWLKVRVTPDERAAFAVKPAEAGPSLSDFIRQQLLTGRVRQTAEEREVIRQLARIGANLNQLADGSTPTKATPKPSRSSSVLAS